MQKQKNRLEVTTLLWEYEDEWQDGFRQGSYRSKDDKPRLNRDGKPKRQYFFRLPDHECEFDEKNCGIYVASIAIHVASDGNGSCKILHPEYTVSGCDHEIQILGQNLRQAFANGYKFHIGGGGVTCVDFKRRSGEPLTDTAMEIYKKLLAIFGFGSEENDIARYAMGPRITQRSYFWSTDLNGWVAFEDRLARKHGLRPINETTSNYDKKPFHLFGWP